MGKDQKLAEALGNRAFYLQKIRDQQEIIENESKFEQLTAYSLMQKKERVQNLFDNFEKKCMDVICVNGTSPTTKEDEEVEAKRDELIAKIDAKLEAYNKPTEQKQMKIGLEHYTIPRLQQSATIQAQPVQSQRPNELPQIAKFSGELGKWFEFQEEFEKEIHNKEMAASIKLVS